MGEAALVVLIRKLVDAHKIKRIALLMVGRVGRMIAVRKLIIEDSDPGNRGGGNVPKTIRADLLINFGQISVDGILDRT